MWGCELSKQSVAGRSTINTWNPRIVWKAWKRYSDGWGLCFRPRRFWLLFPSLSHTHTCEIGWCASTLRRFLIYVYTLYVYTLYVYTLHCWCASTLRRFFVLCVYTLYVYTLYIKQLYTWTTIHMYSICNCLYFQVMCKQWYIWIYMNIYEVDGIYIIVSTLYL